MKNTLGVSPSKGYQGTTRGKEKVVNRGEEKVMVHINVVPRSTMNTNDEQRIPVAIGYLAIPVVIGVLWTIACGAGSFGAHERSREGNWAGRRKNPFLLTAQFALLPMNVVTKTWNQPKPPKTTYNHQQERVYMWRKTTHKIPIRFNTTWKKNVLKTVAWCWVTI